MSRFKEIFESIVDGFNKVEHNVWAIFGLVMGSVLTVLKHETAGLPIITGSFAILQRSDPNKNV